MAVLQNQVDKPKMLTAWEKFGKAVKSSLNAWVYIAPAGLLMLVISLYPQVFQIWMSFTNFGIRNLRFNWLLPATFNFAPAYVGLKNFQQIITSSLALTNYNFLRILGFNVVWTITNLIFHVTLGVIIALVLNQKHLLGRKIYRALFVLPWAIPGYIAALTWRNMFDQNFGAINELAAALDKMFGWHLATNTGWLISATPPIPWLPLLPLAYFALLMANVWLGWPFMTVVATGALQSIPGEMYEAAEMDGATSWQRFWNVTVPMIRPAMVPAIMLGTIWTFNNFSVIYFISNGAPFGQTEILVTQAYKLVNEQRLYGVASAFGIVVFVILFIITMINNRLTRATEAYNA